MLDFLIIDYGIGIQFLVHIIIVDPVELIEDLLIIGLIGIIKAIELIEETEGIEVKERE